MQGRELVYSRRSRDTPSPPTRSIGRQPLFVHSVLLSADWDQFHQSCFTPHFLICRCFAQRECRNESRVDVEYECSFCLPLSPESHHLFIFFFSNISAKCLTIYLKSGQFFSWLPLVSPQFCMSFIFRGNLILFAHPILVKLLELMLFSYVYVAPYLGPKHCTASIYSKYKEGGVAGNRQNSSTGLAQGNLAQRES